MFRTARRILPLCQSLLLGTAAVAAGTLAVSTLAACGDENDPETHVKKLQDPATRPAAVNRLVQFFEDAMTRDNKDRNGKTVKPLLDMIVEPMSQACMGGDLDERTNARLIKFLSDTRDPRAEPCLVKALKDYKPDATEDNVRWAARAVGAMKLKSAAGPLYEVFGKIHASKPKAQAVYRDVHDAMKDLLDPAWKPNLIAALAHPVDPKDTSNQLDEQFWQVTAAELLGLMHADDAVKPLIKVLLNPAKGFAGTTAVLALVKIGKPSIASAVALLNGSDQDMVNYGKTEALKAAGDKASGDAKKAAESSYIGTAALILATIGREETAKPLMESLDGKLDDVSRAIIARELTKLPKTPATVSAFKEAYEKTPPTLSIPPGIGGRETLLDASGMFFEPDLVPWYVKTAKTMKGEDNDLQPIREASLGAAMKLMKADQIGVVEELASMKSKDEGGKATTLGKGFEKEMKLAREILNECGDKVDCYLKKVGDPKLQTQETQFGGIKAAYMIGVLGDAGTRQKILDQMPNINNAAVRFVAVSVIDYLSPKGDKAMAEKLEKIVDDGEQSKDPNKIAGNAPFKTVIYRLNARAQ
jgi:HEAT repeat protein